MLCKPQIKIRFYVYDVYANAVIITCSVAILRLQVELFYNFCLTYVFLKY